MKETKRLCFILLVLVFLMNSCIPLKKFYYLKQKKNDTIKNTNAPIAPIYKLNPGDLLYIKVYAIDEKISQLFNPLNTSLTPGVNELSSINLNSYLVNDSGFVEIPLVGKIYVNNLTIDAAKDSIKTIVKLYVSDADVIVKLLSFKITTLGEFSRPGVYNVYSGKLNILEAIGLAGDITQFGDKSKIMIIRQAENNKILLIDLTDRNLIYSDNFYLRPNDILIAEPYKIKRQNIQFSTISTISVFLASLVNLIILINYIQK